MQSFFQHRKFGQAVQKQLERGYARPIYDAEQSNPVHGISERQQHPRPTSIYDVHDTGRDRNDNVGSVHTQNSKRIVFDQDLAGIQLRPRTTVEGRGGQVLVVGWDDENDPQNPRNWSVIYRVLITIIVASISFVVGAASSADAAILPQSATELGVSDVVESLAIGRHHCVRSHT